MSARIRGILSTSKAQAHRPTTVRQLETVGLAGKSPPLLGFYKGKKPQTTVKLRHFKISENDGQRGKLNYETERTTD